MISALSQASFQALFQNPNFYGIFFFTQADAKLIIDGQKTEIKDNYILFYYPYQQLSVEGEFEGILVQFHPDFFCIDIHAKDIGCQGFLFNNFFNDFLLRCSEKEFRKLFRFYTSLQKELKQMAIGQLDMVSSLLKIFLIRAVRIKKGKSLQLSLSKDNLHHQIEQLIDQNFRKESSADFYVKELDISPSTFNRLCKAYFGNSFINILNLKRIAAAKNRLFLSNLPVKDIAYEVGYNDPLYFSRVFRKHSGISPSEFRRQLKSNRLT
ncbi:MAG: AraC family transcriptional regulator [Bacteroidia bacterium]|nr:AraC family transcriptional regulator [Bacteroidia bacterium]